MNSVRIGDRRVGSGQPCFMIAEAGVNHNGDMNLAHRLIDAASEGRVDAVKFQSFFTEDLVTPNAPKAAYQMDTTGEPGSQYEMLKALELSRDQQAELKRHCEDLGILYLCTPYENRSADLLDELGVAAFKVASTDTTNIPFLRHLARKGRPVILSTGMSTLGEVEEAHLALFDGGLEGKIVLLHCTAEYPAPIHEANLRAIETMQAAFHCPVGLSDHTPGIGVGPWGVAVGACMLEKHFTLDRDLSGPDHQASLIPEEMASLVRSVRQLEQALGDGVKRPTSAELPNKPRMQKSLVVRKPIKAGETFTASHLTCKRPGYGLPPSWIDRVIGQRAAHDFAADTVLRLDSIEWQDE